MTVTTSKTAAVMNQFPRPNELRLYELDAEHLNGPLLGLSLEEVVIFSNPASKDCDFLPLSDLAKIQEMKGYIRTGITDGNLNHLSKLVTR
jgi:hypothetical protein